jgi:hypothetical protein
MQLAPHTHCCPLPHPPSALHWGRHTGALVWRYTQLYPALVQGHEGPSWLHAASARSIQSHRMRGFYFSSLSSALP